MKLIIPKGQYIKCTHCGHLIKDDLAMLNEGRFYCFHCWVSGTVKGAEGDWEGKTCLIKEEEENGREEEKRL